MVWLLLMKFLHVSQFFFLSLRKEGIPPISTFSEGGCTEATEAGLYLGTEGVTI